MKFLAPSVSHRFSRKASEALTANRFVKLNATDAEKVDMCDTANDPALAVVEFDTEADAEAVLMDGGHIPIVAGTGGLSIGDRIVSDDEGRGVAIGATATTSYNVRGIAISEAAEDEIAMMQWAPHTTFGGNAS
jgi:hypothetical protein